eukprot:c39490_g1_i1.p1 GENE.c39490_g1_i1~~c39490_g1_i1.p1  ORF type:complete len:507 (+),score=107.36 c39490_g1_i1:84-1523(+)
MVERNKSRGRGRGGGRGGGGDRNNTSKEHRRKSGENAMADEEEKHSLTIRNTGNFTRSQVLRMIKKACTFAFRYVDFWESGSQTMIMTVDKRELANSISQLSHKLDNGDISIHLSKYIPKPQQEPNRNFQIAVDGATRSRKDPRTAKLQEVLLTRWNQGAGLLNLDQLTDPAPGLKLNLNSQQSVKMLSTACQDFSSQVVSLSANSNQLYTLRVIGSLKRTFPNLKNLSITNNKISDGNELRFLAPLYLCELVVTNNPFTTQGASCGDPVELARVAAYHLRTLLLLDGTPLRQQPELPTIPSTQGSSFDNETTNHIVTSFLTRYLTAFDRDRPSLVNVLHPSCCFSFSATRELCKKPVQLQLKHLRNLAPEKVSLQLEQLHVGAAASLEAMRQLIPGTTHLLQDLLTDSSIVKYAVPEMLLVSVSGTLLIDIENTNSPKKLRFTRAFMLAPSTPESIAARTNWPVSVLNDMVHLTHILS